MKLHWYEQTESTSNAVESRIGLESTPFAVAAANQTAGRGRRGRQWQSPPGNLYLSIAVDVAKMESIGQLPLVTGVVIADFLEQKFGLRCTLKWPNDVLVDGRKLAGILCECPIQGDQIGPAIIGIGLNVHHTPNLSDAPYQATSLHELELRCQLPADIKELAEGFVRFWFERRNWAWGDVSANYADRMIQPGHLLHDESGQLAAIKSIGETGELAIWQGGRERVLRSTATSWQWDLQTAGPFVVADIGNTAVKFGTVTPRQRGLEVRQSVPFVLGGEIPEATKPLVKRGSIVYAMSVNPQGLQQLNAQLGRYGVVLKTIRKRRVRSQGDYPLAQLGIDRLAAVEAFIRKHPGESGVVVSCGTAVTADIIEVGGKHRGGWIAPGMQMALDSMNRGTANLPELTLGGSEFSLALGDSTSTAMRHGVKAAVVGFIREAQRLAPPGSLLLLTGGHAEGLALALPQAMVDSQLLLEGAAYLALAGN